MHGSLSTRKIETEPNANVCKTFWLKLDEITKSNGSNWYLRRKMYQRHIRMQPTNEIFTCLINYIFFFTQCYDSTSSVLFTYLLSNDKGQYLSTSYSYDKRMKALGALTVTLWCFRSASSLLWQEVVTKKCQTRTPRDARSWPAVPFCNHTILYLNSSWKSGFNSLYHWMNYHVDKST